MQKTTIKFAVIYLAITICFTSLFTQAQTVNITDSLAVMDISGTTKGLFPPGITLLQRNQLRASPGMKITCSDCSPAGTYVYNGTTWEYLPAPLISIAYSIGQEIEGGKIFWLDSTKQHGLIASLTDQSAGIKWHNVNYTNTKAVRSGIYGGAFNTDQINTNHGSGTYAAIIAVQYSNGNFGDWYLPSKEELNILFQLKDIIGNLSGTYWSSTEVAVAADESSDFAWSQNFSDGSQSSSTKNQPFNVRAIRKF